MSVLMSKFFLPNVQGKAAIAVSNVFIHAPIADTVNLPTDIFRFAHLLSSCGVAIKK